MPQLFTTLKVSLGFIHSSLFLREDILGPWELLQGQELKVIQKDLAIKLSTELRMIDPHADTKWLDAIYKNMGDHESVLLKAVNDGYGEGGSGSIWTYPGCILFAVSMLTTLG